MSHAHYQNIQSSLLRFCSDFQDEMAADGFSLQTAYLDGFTQDGDWPVGDFIGLAELRIVMEDTYSGGCMFALSTENDPNLHRMGSLMQRLSKKLLPNSSILVYDAETGDEIGDLLIMNGTHISPPLPTKSQPLQPIGIQFESNLLARG